MASFFPEEIPETISLGATYPDYATFTRKFEEYCKDTGYEFSTNSKTIESANKLILNDEKHFAKKFKYICVQFVCKHVRGSEMNEKKSTRGCPAMIRLCANRSKDVLEVTKFNDIHVHSVKDRASDINVDRPANEATDSSDDVTPEVSTTKVQPANDQNETSPGDNSNSIVPQDGDETSLQLTSRAPEKRYPKLQ
ncbi:hypothetical protein CAPTEDRAFT_201958 [Capitella teleta]|uniref:ZSWIM3 N-terminal domain-containing protein n=1 Tax=Capitella teleta TaxID=283909 RepID=R7V4M8_CAPTE|nr:hypothetical protein CAPTEDRAFT_201958 [Capitella teleta]|eukprot:ELU13524.1 hypothetical protein CAPTEDRAFT_201958 [Capitella teleta]